MAAELDVWLCDAQGIRVLPLANFQRLNYTRAINDVGELEVTLPGHFDTQLVRADSLIMVYRDGRLDTETAWLVQQVTRRTERNGVQGVTLRGRSGTHLLTRRVVLAGDDKGNKQGTADNLLKAYVRENAGSSAAQARQLPAFTVAADTAQGTVVPHEGARRELLAVCQDLAKASTDAGVPLFFDVVWLAEAQPASAMAATIGAGWSDTASWSEAEVWTDGTMAALSGAALTGRWELRTYTGQRGTDKSRDTAAPQTLSLETGTIGLETLDEDYADEITVIYAGGQGDEDDQPVITVEDAIRSGRSIYGRREAWISSGSGPDDEIQAEAQAALQRGRPWRTYSAEVISASHSQYGRDWLFGDVVTVNAYGQQFDCRVDAVSVTVDNLDGGRETVRVRLTNVADL